MIPDAFPLVLGALALIFGSFSQAAQPLSPSLASLVDTERAFAKMSVDRGRRAAFLAFFGEDALFFTPEPAPARSIVSKWPESGPFVLDWEPRFGDVARSGDLGYTTGPFVRTSIDRGGKVLGTGWYFTIWKKVNGSWKVAVDAGVTTPAAGALRPAPLGGAAPGGESGRRAATPLISADRALCAGIKATGVQAALASVAADDAIVFREGETPLTGRAAIGSYFASHPDRIACEPVKAHTAISADLGYTYGTYTTEKRPAGHGYYLRVWKQRAGEWRLAIELLVGD